MLNTLRQIGVINLANGPPTLSGNEFAFDFAVLLLCSISKTNGKRAKEEAYEKNRDTDKIKTNHKVFHVRA